MDDGEMKTKSENILTLRWKLIDSIERMLLLYTLDWTTPSVYALLTRSQVCLDVVGSYPSHLLTKVFRQTNGNSSRSGSRSYSTNRAPSLLWMDTTTGRQNRPKDKAYQLTPSQV